MTADLPNFFIDQIELLHGMQVFGAFDPESWRELARVELDYWELRKLILPERKALVRALLTKKVVAQQRRVRSYQPTTHLIRSAARPYYA